MLAMNLIDVSDRTDYGILLCNNDSVSEETLQNKIYELKDLLSSTINDWFIDDLIEQFPPEWNIHLQKKNHNLVV